MPGSSHKKSAAIESSKHMRITALVGLMALFFLVVIATCRGKGLRALCALGTSFLILIKGILPAMLSGMNPVLVIALGGIPMVALIVYCTEGFTARAHIGLATITAALFIAALLSWVFIQATGLSGFTSEEVGYIAGFGARTIDLRMLLLAGIIVGALGVLDDMAISQIAATEELHHTNPSLSRSELFMKAYRIGATHLGSIVNTLFLVYAGASLPILLLFTGSDRSMMTIFQNELVTTELVRTLCGTIAILLSMPLSTVLTVWWLKRS
jgi:uncharacterized membrane protein